ncbi:PTS sugar transporter subunit IIA [Amedibacillus sp. YH-ame10]
MELITENLIVLDQNVEDKTSLLAAFATILEKEKRINNKLLFMEDVMEREQIASTAIGDGIAIPHAISTAVTNASLVFIRLHNEILWNNEDRVKYIFGIAIPSENKDNQHLKILSSLARHLLDEKFKKNLLDAQTQEKCVQLLDELQ